MNIGLGLETDIAIESLSHVVTELEDALKACFQGRDYGRDLENIFIGVILAAPDSEQLHPVRALRFKKHVRYTFPNTDVGAEFRNVVEYDVKPDYSTFGQLSPTQARQHLFRVLLESISILEEHKHKYPDFDIRRFREDFKACLLT
jgi:hypothetical protein